ncbi:MAG: hypothetical protein HDT37_07095 [Clostridiales bacterium]|nr:hypothetical protein [Clostridiales bacterium]
MELVVSFSKDDTELITALEKQFGHTIQCEENKNFDGLDVLLTVAIPIAAVSVQIVDFILSHFYSDKGKHNNKGKQRVLILPNGSIDLRGYTEKEARRIIECYFKNQNKNNDE